MNNDRNRSVNFNFNAHVRGDVAPQPHERANRGARWRAAVDLANDIAGVPQEPAVVVNLNQDDRANILQTTHFANGRYVVPLLTKLTLLPKLTPLPKLQARPTSTIMPPAILIAITPPRTLRSRCRSCTDHRRCGSSGILRRTSLMDCLTPH